MSEPFDPAPLAEAMAGVLGIDLAPEQRDAVLLHLRIAADHAALLAGVPLGDDVEPAPIYTP